MATREVEDLIVREQELTDTLMRVRTELRIAQSKMRRLRQRDGLEPKSRARRRVLAKARPKPVAKARPRRIVAPKRQGVVIPHGRITFVEDTFVAPPGAAPPAAPPHTYDPTTYESPKCTICLDDMGSETTATLVPCLHVFHKECVGPWVLAHRTCPNCRGHVSCAR
jgi:hypothetical protein